MPGSGVNLATAYVTILPSTQGLGKAIQRQVGSEADGAGAGVGRRFSTGFGGVVKKLGAVAAIAGVSVGVGKTLQAGLARVTTIQDATVSLKTILGSQAKAAEFSDRILKTVQGTPFNLDQFMTAGKNLVAFGLDAAKVPGILTAIGDSAAASGKGAEAVGQLTDVFGKMAASGKVDLRSVWEVSAAGVPALQILANHFGVTTEEMQKMISKGTVPATEAIDALTSGIENGSTGVAGSTVKFGGSMAALRQTFNGALGGFKASIARLGAGVMGPLLDPMTLGLQKMTGGIDAFTKNVVTPAMTFLIGSAKDAGGKLGPIFATIGSTIGGAFTAIKPMLAQIGPALSSLFANIGPMLGQVAAQLGEAFRQVGPSIMQLLPLLSPVGLLFRAMQPVLPQIAAGVGQIATAIGGALLEVMRALTPVLPVVVGALAQVAAVLAGALGTALGSLAPLLPVLADALGQIGKTVGGALTTAFRVLAPLLPKLLGSIAQLASILVGALARALTQLLPFVAKLAVTIGDIAARVLTALLPVLPSLVSAFLSILNAVMPLLPPILQLAQVLLGVLIPVINVLLPIVAGLAVVLATVLAGAVRALGAIVAGVFTGIKVAVGAAIAIVRGHIAIAVGVLGGLRSAVGFVGQAFKAAWDAVSGWVGKIVGVVAGLPGKIGALAGQMLDAGKRLMGAMFDGLKHAASAVGGFAADVGSAIWNAIKGFVNDHLLDPLRGFGVHIHKGPFHLDLTPFSGLPRLAKGGIIPATPGGVPFIAGEAGKAEAVIPLDRLDRMLANGKQGGGDNYWTIYEATDAVSVAHEVARMQRRPI